MKIRTCCAVLALLVIGALAIAQDGKDPATKLYREYLELRPKTDYKNAKFWKIRKLGDINSATSRKYLLKILMTTRSLDERVIATLSLGRVADQETAKSWLDWMEKKHEGPLHQAFGEALGRVTDPELRAWLAGPAFKTGRREVQQALADAQIVLADPVAVPGLVALYEKFAKRKNGAPVAAAAARALGSIGGDEASAVLLRAAAHGESEVQRAAAASIPRQSHRTKELDAALRSLLQGGTAAARRAGYRAIGKEKLEDFFPDLIEALSNDPRLRNRQVAYEALKAISGRDFSHDADTWRRWWKDRESSQPVASGYTFAKYYGFGVYSDRIVFVVDVSGSMNWSFHKRPRRIDVARRQLFAVLKKLPKKTLFNIVVYSTRVASWQKSEVEATPANVAKALRWSERMLAEPDGDTHAFDALEKVFHNNPSFDTVFFLSDGWPSHGDYISTEGIIAAVRSWNRQRDAVLHTIALTLENVDRGHPQSSTARLKQMKDFLRKLSQATGGRCKAITNAPP